jgi:ubiquinone/menaquinone biosynthesis C-methylase UbiE
MDERQRQAGSFGAAAEVYERSRPGYPENAIDWLLPAGASHVLDLAAGTGKLTRQLVARGLDVVAVDPAEEMLEQLRAAVPGTSTFVGTAEEIPLKDNAVDAVVVAQGWHWVDPERASREVARVLRPAGQLGLIWNQRDEREPWVAEFGKILEGGFRHDFETPTVGPPFGKLERFETQWCYELDLPTLLDLVSSRSYVIVQADAQRAPLLDRVRELAERELERTGATKLAMPYVTQSFRAHV